jgi:hypothetical protein
MSKKDNVLKKEFKQKDVQRLRNLLTKKHGDKTTVGIGYSKQQEFHKEGDIWEEDGRKWTIKNGVKQNITKMDEAKKAHVMPLFCPSCNKIMKTHRDKNYYTIHRKCLNCVVDFETELKRIGAWEEYQNRIHNSEIDGFINEFKSWIEDSLTESNQGFVSEDGHVERWLGGADKNRVLGELDKTIEYLSSLKK